MKLTIGQPLARGTDISNILVIGGLTLAGPTGLGLALAHMAL